MSIRKWGEGLQGDPSQEDKLREGVSLPSPVGSTFRVGGSQDLQAAGESLSAGGWPEWQDKDQTRADPEVRFKVTSEAHEQLALGRRPWGKSG